MHDPYFPIFWAVDAVLNLFLLILIVRIALAWLISFQVINPRHPATWQLERYTKVMTDPVLRPVQRMLPAPGGIDLSPVIIIIVVTVIQMYLWQLYYALR